MIPANSRWRYMTGVSMSPETASASVSTPAPIERVPWSTMRPDAVARELGVDPLVGLTTEEVAARVERHGLNRLTSPPARPRWKLFLDQFRAGIVYVLFGASVLAGALGDVKDAVVILVVLVINAILGFAQEARASNALAALERMLVTRVRVRRDGEVVECVTEDLVPGDVVLLEAGDRVPADGRLFLAANLSIDEASLTGESVPVDKHAESLAPADSPLGDRHGMVFMNTTVVRGRAEVMISSTGMQTEMGRVADLLNESDTPSTPLQRQLDGLSKRLALIAGGAAVLVFTLQILQGQPFAEAAVGAVALAIAAIPEGLPAVVTVTLAIGISQMAKKNAIVKRLHSVETLGSTTVICSDKTGTLTLNQMTAREVMQGGAAWSLSGEGYSPVGEITDANGSGIDGDRTVSALLAAALCSDAVVRVDDDGVASIVGDPTEAALVVAASKSGIDIAATRSKQVRLAEVPFDSTTKFMSTFHRVDPADPDSDVLVCVKGAPDVLLARVTSFVDSDGAVQVLDETGRIARQADNDHLASKGMRVLALATRRLPAGEILNHDGSITDPENWIHELRLDALVGIVDPPRSEARDAIRLCRVAGVSVKMITGDHAVTAGAIAAELGIDGRVVTGDDLDQMSDEELAAQIDSIGVCARVSPEHKVRVVEALQSNKHVVAMTGDGVNDAAALRRADIGVAMGITGTEVTKEAGDMVLTDDNFATIVGAVERGRTIYDNILKFVRFQLATSMGAISTILGASLLNQPVPFSPLQVLWVNLIADGPPAITLGVDAPASDIMTRPPIRSDAQILTKARLSQVLFQGVVMGVATLGLFIWAHSVGHSEVLASTMAFTAFVLAQLVNVFNARSETQSLFSMYTFTNKMLLGVVFGVTLLQVAATTWAPFESLFGTTDLTLVQWGQCLLVPLVLLVGAECWKFVARRKQATRFEQ
ncbi:MAG: HAD-IC family P-type ATPase [Actinobacteria bacterium]|nr:HAD-IC family P-type ATPase [Actinomycetota bacterium]